MNLFQSLNGIPVLLDEHLLDSKPSIVKRTWVERLFSFTPFKPTRTIYRSVPSRKIINCQGRLIMHPEIYKEFVATMENDNETC